jgi:tRNA1(Val) A37 N6-methylase TrmN6
LIEIDARLTALAEQNAQANAMGVHAVTLDALAPADSFAAAGVHPQSYDRVLMNPPFNDPARHRMARDAQRRLAHAAGAEALEGWIETAARLLRSRGTLSLIWRAEALGRILRAVEPIFGGITILPVHPRPGACAIRVLVGATKGSRAPLALLPPLMLNDITGRPSAEAESVLRAGAPLALAAQ